MRFICNSSPESTNVRSHRCGWARFIAAPSSQTPTYCALIPPPPRQGTRFWFHPKHLRVLKKPSNSVVSILPRGPPMRQCSWSYLSLPPLLGRQCGSGYETFASSLGSE